MFRKHENMVAKATSVPAIETPGDEVFIVDDDPQISDLLGLAFESEGYRVTSFRDGETFSAAARQRAPACVILDVCMPGRSGLEILKDLDAHNFPAPIIVMSGRASIAMAVEAIKSGAFDIIEKPFLPEALVGRVREVVNAWTRRPVQGSATDILPVDFPGRHKLTRREIEVLSDILTGGTNKEVGSHLGISPRTIEAHRSHIMMKLGAKNTADLVRIVLSKPAH
jgi:two-component system, LuxR family, response regulator FixJ